MLAVLGLAVLTASVTVAVLGYLVYRQAEESLTRVPVEGLTEAPEESEDLESATTDARHFLVVGSDSREDADDSRAAALGDVEGQRSDALLYVTISEDRDTVSVLSLPRDLHVRRDGRDMRLGETFTGGAGELVSTIQEELGLPVHHYAKVTFDGFIGAVDTLGGVDICLDEELRDPDAGADLAAGCQRLGARDALAFVRSRQGDRADLERIDRQQRFLRATLQEATDRRLLADVPRLLDVVEDVAGNLTTDEDLSVRQLLGLAEEVRGMVRDDDVPMATVPAHPVTVDGRDLLRPYVPGARAMFETVKEGDPIADLGTPREREDTAVAIWSGHRDEGADTISSTLLFGGFADRVGAGPGPDEVDAGATTTVLEVDGGKPAAERVAALLGAPVRELPAGIEAPRGVEVVVAVGDDARMPDVDRDVAPRREGSDDSRRAAVGR